MSKSVVLLLLINIIIVFSVVLITTKAILVKIKNRRISKFENYTFSNE